MTRFALVCLVLAAACGDNHDGPTRADASTQLPDAAEPQPTAFVVSGDFDMTGLISKLDLKTLSVAPNVGPTGAVGGDPVVRHVGDRLYVINRFGSNNVTILNAQTLAFVDQISTGESSNPQDVARDGETLYVPALGTTGMVKIASDGTTSIVDLGTALGDPDGHPDCVTAYAVDGKVYVACGLLDDNFAPRGPAKVAVYDTANGNVSSVTLPFANPQNFMVRHGSDLFISLVPSFTDYSTGCVARVSTGTSPAASCVDGLSNADIGGFQTHIDVADGGTMLWMAVGTLDGSFSNPTGSLKGYDFITATLWDAPLSPSTQLINDVAACPDGNVVVVDRTMNAAGLRVYSSTDATEKTTAALAFGLPPSFGNNIACYDVNAP